LIFLHRSDTNIYLKKPELSWSRIIVISWKSYAKIFCNFIFPLPAYGSCSRAPVITINNDSLVTITNISLVGSGFSETIPSLEASKAISIRVHPQGESGLEIRFDTPSGRIKKDELAYIETSGGY